MKDIRFAKAALVIAAFLTAAQFAGAQLVLDDFSSGPYFKQLESGSDTNSQSGSMIGGTRSTTFFACPPGPCGLRNQFAQPSSIEVRGATKIAPSALIMSSGYKAAPRLDVEYGNPNPLSLNLSASYDRLRVTFDGASEIVNFNILVYSSGGYSQTGCNLSAPAYGQPFSVDFPFAYFTSGADFSDVVLMDFIFQAEGSIGSEDWAVTSFEAIPIGAAAADITCYGLK